MVTSNRRRFHRVPGPFDGTWSGTSGRRVTRITDCSLGGCFIDHLSPPPPEERVQVTIHLPGEATSIEVGGRVVYADAVQGFAVEFVDVDAGTAKRLRAALARLSA